MNRQERRRRSALAWLVGALVTVALREPGSLAADTGDIVVTDAWSRVTPPGVRVGVVYLTLECRGSADRLIGLETDTADEAEIHEVREVNGRVQMRKVSTLDLVANESVTLAPGGLHVMLIGLHEPLAAGSRHTLTLEFESAGRIAVDVEVRAP